MGQRGPRIRRGRVDGGEGTGETGDRSGEVASSACLERPPAGGLRPTLLGALLLGTIASAAAHLAVDHRRAALAEQERLQAETVAEAHAALISARVAGLSQVARRITASELVQVYAAGAAEPDEPSGWLADQTPFLAQMFEDFVSQHGLIAASLVAADGEVILTLGELPEGPALPERAGNGIDPVVTPVYELVRDGVPEHALAFDLVLPIPGLASPDEAAAPALLVMTLDAPATLSGALAQGERGAPVLIQEVGPELRLRLGDAGRQDPADVVTARVEGTPWRLEQPVGSGRTAARLAAYQRRAYALAGVVAVLLATAFGLFCGAAARRRRREHELAREAAADQARRFGELFESLAERVSDGVGIKASDGRYVYVNSALSERLGRAPEEVIGRTDAEIGEEASGDGPSPGLPVPFEARSLVGADLEADGPALVVLHHAHRPAEPAARGRAALPAAVAGRLTVDQAVDLLVRAVELRDPFLKGHGERVAELAGAVALRMGLNAAERMTLELAGRLSQVGKIFIPDAILTKPGRHSEEEARIMRSHIERTLDLLEGIELGLPVAFVLGQMHERLDGSGYPRGLSGEEISLPGRILGAVDVFCARSAPRAYRDQITAGQALFHLAGHPERFDARVVTALVGVFAERRGESPALPAPQCADAA